MNKLTEWIKQHQVAAFFLLTFAVTWGALIPAVAMSSKTCELFHASMNATNVLMEVFPITNAGNALLITFGLFAILYDRMWEELPADHPATTYRATSKAAWHRLSRY